MRLLAVAGVVLVVMTGAASAARPPTLAERTAITNALPAAFRAMPAGCLFLAMKVSKSGTYAEVDPTFLLRRICIKYASNGYLILHKVKKWRIIWSGSEVPKCKLHVPRDLVKTCMP
ncbi:MAG TPA: hypothetical protein VGQ38_11080 [Gaiellaceae bacterium]|nr:hypothetical protein [Gaiellaceae bacterium]